MSQKHSIHRLDPQTANAIAAGEVVERPASVVKELVENALDAGADKIDIDIQNGGIKLIRVTDNGSGIAPDDLAMAFERHATSKIEKVKDLDSIRSMGFRGEALASISAVSKFKAESRTKDDAKALCLIFEGGELQDAKASAHPVGTTMEVRELFYNTPARFKFLKSDNTERSYIQDIVSKIALAKPDVSFRLKEKDKILLHTPGNNDVPSVLYLLWGKAVAQGMHPIKAVDGSLTLEGYVARADLSRHNRSRQIVFVNGRYIQSQLIRTAIDEAAKTWFMKGRHPQLVLHLSLPGTEVDVNVHPQKTEVRFADERAVFSLIYHSLQKRFQEISSIPEADFTKRYEARPTADPKPAVPPKATQESFNLPLKNDPLPLVKEPIQKDETQAEQASKTKDRRRHERLHHEEQSAYFIEQKTPVHLADAPLDRPIDELLQGRLIGQVFKTFLLVEHAEELLLVDQHAAHERVLYEAFSASRKEAKNQGLKAQELLAPQSVSLEPVLIALAEEHRELIEKEGYRFENFGPQTLILRSVPYTVQSKVDSSTAFRLLLEQVQKGSLGVSTFDDELDQELACKAAIKANDSLSYEEMKQLLKDLVLCQNPYHCPHGRPTVTRLHKKDLEKLFKRIV